MTDRIDEAIAASLQRILRNWDPTPHGYYPATFQSLRDSIQEEIEWLRMPG